MQKPADAHETETKAAPVLTGRPADHPATGTDAEVPAAFDFLACGADVEVSAAFDCLACGTDVELSGAFDFLARRTEEA